MSIRLHWRTGQVYGAHLWGTQTKNNYRAHLRGTKQKTTMGHNYGAQKQITNRGTSTGHETKNNYRAHLRGTKQKTNTGHNYGARKQITNRGTSTGHQNNLRIRGTQTMLIGYRSVLALVFYPVFPSCSYSVLKGEFGFTIFKFAWLYRPRRRVHRLVSQDG
jgi:hypothetical protein